MKECYVKITPSGIVSTVQIDRESFNETIYRLINCEVWEGVPVHVPGVGGLYMILDENGKIGIRPKMFNYIASKLYNNPLDFIVGDVIICDLRYVPSDEPGIEEELDCCPLTDVQSAGLFSYIIEIMRRLNGL